MKNVILKADSELDVVSDSNVFKSIFDLLKVMWDEDNQEYEADVDITICNGLVYDIHLNDTSLGYFAIKTICDTLGFEIPEVLLICDEDELDSVLENDFVDTDVYILNLIGDLKCV